ncbi:MAG: methyl-accepting chemotaxis protein [Asticcacaulis sp.]
MSSLLANEDAISLADILDQTTKAKAVTGDRVREIRKVTTKLRILALNALIEAKHAGEKGAGFSVVADEVRNISGEVELLAKDLGDEVVVLESLMSRLAQQSQGQRLTDLALNAVEIIDRNLYERTCDVRWWATDSAIVDHASSPSQQSQLHACRRLGVILDSYTVYLDLWLCNLEGDIIANGRPGTYNIIGQNVRGAEWFRKALSLNDGSEFTVADISCEALLNHAQVATYATGVRAGGLVDGKLVGVLGIHFDWQPQAEAVVEGVRLTDEEKATTRALLVDANGRVIANTGGRCLLNERIRISAGGRQSGYYTDESGRMLAFHRTPGYETYQGLGWYGVIAQK